MLQDSLKREVISQRKTWNARIGRFSEFPSYSKPACPAFSRWVMCVREMLSAWLQLSAKGLSPSHSSIKFWRNNFTSATFFSGDPRGNERARNRPGGRNGVTLRPYGERLRH